MHHWIAHHFWFMWRVRLLTSDVKSNQEIELNPFPNKRNTLYRTILNLLLFKDHSPLLLICCWIFCCCFIIWACWEGNCFSCWGTTRPPLWWGWCWGIPCKGGDCLISCICCPLLPGWFCTKTMYLIVTTTASANSAEEFNLNRRKSNYFVG